MLGQMMAISAIYIAQGQRWIQRRIAQPLV